jgi:hypothetical protein
MCFVFLWVKSKWFVFLCLLFIGMNEQVGFFVVDGFVMVDGVKAGGGGVEFGSEELLMAAENLKKSIEHAVRLLRGFE